MGSLIAANALGKGCRVVGYDASAGRADSPPSAVERAASLPEFADWLERPRRVLVYAAQGKGAKKALRELRSVLEPDDVVADLGRSHWRDSIRHHQEFLRDGIGFLDVGTTGDLEGARPSFTVGGEAGVFALLRPFLADLAAPGGVAHVGPAGAGHFVKAIHDAVETAMVEALGEGVDLLARGGYGLDVAAVLESWSQGSTLRGRLTEVMARTIREERLEERSTSTPDVREVGWAIGFALDRAARIPVILQSQLARERQRDSDDRAGMLVALLRKRLGG
jgi:6-phosphogluconate dehydrogenase